MMPTRDIPKSARERARVLCDSETCMAAARAWAVCEYLADPQRAEADGLATRDQRGRFADLAVALAAWAVSEEEP